MKVCPFKRRYSTALGINEYRARHRSRMWSFTIIILLILIICCSRFFYVNPTVPEVVVLHNVSSNNTRKTYKYLLIDGTTVSMQHEKINNLHTSYPWFMSMKPLFENLGKKDEPIYPVGTPACRFEITNLGPISVKKTPLKMELVEKEHAHVKPGGFGAPAHCRSRHRLAIFVPYRNREKNLSIFLYYIHRLMKIHLIQYRIFVIEQVGTEKFNKGILFNIAFLESQRFGTFDCLIFHDVDVVPEDDRIYYTCSQSPFHFASAVEKSGYRLRYQEEFGSVTGLKPDQFEAVNGYSNFYWNWGGVDDDMSARLKFTNFEITRYDAFHDPFMRFASLPHQESQKSGKAKYIAFLLHFGLLFPSANESWIKDRTEIIRNLHEEHDWNPSKSSRL